ncbi:MAG: signal peptide peptidase SppA [Rickettsiales bacterium]|jgi:signal peptide peptidase SppA
MNCKNTDQSNCLIGKIKNFLCKKTQNIAVVNLSGVIGKGGKIEPGINIENVEPILIKAFETKKLKSVAINVNSPGGSPVQSELIYQRIIELSKEKKIPVFTFAQDVAASGGYFILLAGDEIFAHNASIVGSIGVISAGFGFEDLIKKAGIERRIYAQGKNKAVLDPFSPEDEDSIEILKSAQKDVYESFKDLVKERRQDKLNASEEKLLNGAFWSGKTALDLGLIDGISDMRSKMKEKFGDKVKFINIEPKKKGMIKEFLSGKLENIGSGIISSVIDKVEEKTIWNKFKL